MDADRVTAVTAVTVVPDGRVARQGPPAEPLTATGGPFRDPVRRQPGRPEATGPRPRARFRTTPAIG
jgi:hypothetical protein